MTMDGTYDCTLASPAGERSAILTVDIDGVQFSGTFSSGFGVFELVNGKVADETLTWALLMREPTRGLLLCEASVDEDGTLSGFVRSDAFGEMMLSGARR
jgi:hypothetical protein